MNNVLKIFENDAISPAVLRANSYLLETNKEILESIQNPRNKFNHLEDLWKREFDVNIEKSKDEWEQLIFENEQKLLVFLIKWQS
jgi:hypothetical protein